MTDTIVIVDDEQHIIDLAKMYLEGVGYQTASATEGNAALKLILTSAPTLVVLDLMLPGLDGWEICKRVRAQSDVPIIMLTARSDDIDRIVGLELGADDYLTKPFNPRELVARIKAILRRTRGTDERPATEKERTLTVENVTIYPERRIVTIDGKPIDLRMKEFDLLLALADHKGMVFSREKLLAVVWGYDFPGETRTVDVHIAHLRHKLTGMRPTIETVWGVGYRLDG
ncbi:MAG: response regulator transcription factor [Chloroflexota bacterium]|nr:response regulator transcription factor [Chloroflexota bacterium]